MYNKQHNSSCLYFLEKWLEDLLCICFLKESTPKFIPFFWMNKNKLSATNREQIINYNIYPFTIAPKSKMKDASIFFRFLIIPVLSLMIRYDLSEYRKIDWKIYRFEKTKKNIWPKTIYIYIYIYIGERERERERHTHTHTQRKREAWENIHKHYIENYHSCQLIRNTWKNIFF